MRGARRLLVAGLLLCTLTISAIVVGLAAYAMLRVIPFENRPAVATGIALALIALELACVRTLAVHRQVPQWWGHRYGPVAAAARYGLRMGIGPATILTSWFWWSGLLIGGLSALPVALLSALSFSLARFSTMFGLASGSPTGVEMATRVTRVQQNAQRAHWFGIAAVSIAVLAVIL